MFTITSFSKDQAFSFYVLGHFSFNTFNNISFLLSQFPPLYTSHWPVLAWIISSVVIINHYICEYLLFYMCIYNVSLNNWAQSDLRNSKAHSFNWYVKLVPN